MLHNLALLTVANAGFCLECGTFTSNKGLHWFLIYNAEVDCVLQRALIDVLYLMATLCSVCFRGLVYFCLICSGSKNDKLDVTLRSIGHHTLNKVCVIHPAADLVVMLCLPYISGGPKD